MSSIAVFKVKLMIAFNKAFIACRKPFIRKPEVQKALEQWPLLNDIQVFVDQYRKVWLDIYNSPQHASRELIYSHPLPVTLFSILLSTKVISRDGIASSHIPVCLSHDEKKSLVLAADLLLMRLSKFLERDDTSGFHLTESNLWEAEVLNMEGGYTTEEVISTMKLSLSMGLNIDV